MSNLTCRKSSIIVPDASSKFTPAGAYTVCACEVGAIAAAASSGTSITVDAGHGFAVNDYLLLNPGADNDNGYDAFVLVSGAGSTTLTVATAVGIAVGDVLFNLGPDGATGGTPDYDGSGATIYSDMGGGDTITNSVVTASYLGVYSYWHKGGDIWEVIRNGVGVPVEWLPTSGQIASMTSSTDNGLVRSDGTSGRKLQDSGVTVDDSDNLDVPGTLTVDGASTLTGAITTGGDLAVGNDFSANGEVGGSTLAIDTTSVLTGKVTCAGEVQIGTVLNHDGTTVGFYGTTPAVQSSATTINELSPSSTLNNNTAVAVVDNTGGSASQTLAAITGGGAGCEDATKNAVASLADEVNALFLDLENTNKFVAYLANKLKLTGIIG